MDRQPMDRQHIDRQPMDRQRVDTVRIDRQRVDRQRIDPPRRSPDLHCHARSSPEPCRLSQQHGLAEPSAEADTSRFKVGQAYARIWLWTSESSLPLPAHTSWRETSVPDELSPLGDLHQTAAVAQSPLKVPILEEVRAKALHAPPPKTGRIRLNSKTLHTKSLD